MNGSEPLHDLTPAQRQVLDALAATTLGETLYLSGGTALSACYLHHRTSDDLDLFSRESLDLKAIGRFIADIADGQPKGRRFHDRLGYVLSVGGEKLKVEFVHYDHDSIEPPEARLGDLRVDSLRDILANKLSAVVERTEPKDFADLVLLLRLLPLEQGISDCQAKFGWPALPTLLQQALLRAEGLTAWPALTPPLSIEEARAELRDHVRTLIRLEDPTDSPNDLGRP